MARLPRSGRRKIEMKLIEKERDRAVTLSKRHGGLFKKAGELATLCGVQIAIILFTISGKPLSFGSPNVAKVFKKFLDTDHGNQQPDAIATSVNSFRQAKINDLNDKFDDFNQKSTSDKKDGKTLEEDVKVLFDGKTYEDHKSSIGIEKLIGMKHKLEWLKRELQNGGDHAHESGPSSSFKDNEYEGDLSNMGGPKDFLKL